MYFKMCFIMPNLLNIILSLVYLKHAQHTCIGLYLSTVIWHEACFIINC